MVLEFNLDQSVLEQDLQMSSLLALEYLPLLVLVARSPLISILRLPRLQGSLRLHHDVTTDFTISGGYEVGLIDVFLNGVKQRSGTDFLATTGTGVTMTPAVNDGDVLEFQKFSVIVGSSGGTSYSGTTGQVVRNDQHNGSDYVGVSSVGIATFINDHHQGYYYIIAPTTTLQ